MTQHLSSMTIDGLASGLLAEPSARAHLESCARCRGDLEAAEAACATFTRDVLPRTIGKLRPVRSRWVLAWPALAAAALAAIAVVVWIGKREHPAPAIIEDDGAIRMKGVLAFQVFASRRDEVFAVHDATKLAAGDKIRFVVGAGTARPYLLVGSVDGAGNATIYYPYGGAHSGPAPAAPSELPGSIVLDAAPGPERVFALASAQPLDAMQVTRALLVLGKKGAAAIRATAVLDNLPAVQQSIVFEKIEKVTP
jgi:hypothetical protein